MGVIVSMDTFGLVSDNAQGIAEMSGGVEGEGARILTSLDAVGNSTKAITKGIAIATAVLAATALFGAFRDAVAGATAELLGAGADLVGQVGQQDSLQYTGILNVANPSNLVGLIIGASVVFLFSGLAINAVSRAAGAGASLCPPSVARKSVRASAEPDWRVVSSASCVPPFSHLRCRSASPSYDGLSPSEIWRTPRGVPGRHGLADYCHAAV